MADQSERIRARLEEIFQGWCNRVAVCLEEAQVAGEIPPDVDPHELAEFWLNSWQGAILRAKIARSTAPLRTFLNIILNFVLA
jgi:TetR/AcrR family transcriptional repressor of nem operon